jgi:hypothetical protein
VNTLVFKSLHNSHIPAKEEGKHPKKDESLAMLECKGINMTQSR